MKSKIYFLILFLSMTFIIQSCSGVIKMDKIPELQGGSPLSGIKTVIFTVNHFKDDRGSVKEFAGDERTVGMSGGVQPNYRTDRQVNDIVRQAIINELIRNGHRVVATEDSSKANVIIDGTVRQYWAWFEHHHYWPLSYEHTVLGSVKADITVKFSDSGSTFSKSFNGAADLKTYAGFTKGKCESVLNEALLNMVKDFTMDLGFLDGLNKTEKGKLNN